MKLRRRWLIGIAAVICVSGLLTAAVDLCWYEFFPRQFYVVEDGSLFRGARQKDRAFQSIIRDRHCKTVVSLTGLRESHQEIAAQEGAKYIVYDWKGNGVGPFEEYQEVAKILADPAARPLFYHCAGGQHRTNAATFAYLLEKGVSVEEALAKIREYRFDPDQDRTLAEHLRAYAAWRK